MTKLLPGSYIITFWYIEITFTFLIKNVIICKNNIGNYSSYISIHAANAARRRSRLESSIRAKHSMSEEKKLSAQQLAPSFFLLSRMAE